MEDITDKLSNLNIGKQKVLYYSIVFTYSDIMNLIRKTLFDSKESDNISGAYIKTSDSFELFDGKASDDNKLNITNKYSTHIEKFKPDEKFIIYNDTLYTANSEFHITTLFAGGKVHEKSADMESQLKSKVLVKINKLAVSEKFITIGIESIKLEDGTDIFYYGNEVKHITIGLNKTGKKVFPKDSYTALSDGKIYDLDHIVEGATSKVVQ